MQSLNREDLEFVLRQAAHEHVLNEHGNYNADTKRAVDLTIDIVMTALGPRFPKTQTEETENV